MSAPHTAYKRQFRGRLMRGRLAGWWTFEIEWVDREDRPTDGSIMAILFQRPDDAWVERTVRGYGGDLDYAVAKIVDRYGGYEVYIPTPAGARERGQQ